MRENNGKRSDNEFTTYRHRDSLVIAGRRRHLLPLPTCEAKPYHARVRGFRNTSTTNPNCTATACSQHFEFIRGGVTLSGQATDSATISSAPFYIAIYPSQVACRLISQ
jgi:hypothetical protein